METNIDLTCSICLEYIKEFKDKKTLPCEHMFHTECINLYNKSDCPICKKEYSKIELICKLCNKEILSFDDKKTLRCEHMFHKSCIRYSITCVVCTDDVISHFLHQESYPEIEFVLDNQNQDSDSEPEIEFDTDNIPIMSNSTRSEREHIRLPELTISIPRIRSYIYDNVPSGRNHRLPELPISMRHSYLYDNEASERFTLQELSTLRSDINRNNTRNEASERIRLPELPIPRRNIYRYSTPNRPPWRY